MGKSWVIRLGQTLWTAVKVALAAIMGIIGVGQTFDRHLDVVGGIVLLATIGAMVVVARWRRHTHRGGWILFIMQLLLPIGPQGSLIVTRFVRTQPVRTVIAGVTVYSVGLARQIIWDVWGGPAEESLLRSTSPDVNGSVQAVVTGFILLWLLPLLVGVWQRSRDATAVAQKRLRDEEYERRDLQRDRDRRAERDAMAREIHDRIGRRLSLLSLNAGVIEVSADGDDELAYHARALRNEAEGAVDELRSLVRVMRAEGSGPLGASGEASSIRELPALFEAARLSGHDATLRLNLPDDMIGEGSEVGATERAVHRIVGELLTNSIKHAAGESVVVEVTGDPHRGVTVTSHNPMAGPSGDGRGTGLTGIRERAEALGGWANAWDHAGRFHVSVWMPWKDANPGRRLVK